MLPKNKLASKMISKLKIYAGAEHPHAIAATDADRVGGEIAEEYELICHCKFVIVVIGRFPDDNDQ